MMPFSLPASWRLQETPPFWQCLHKIRGIREIRGRFLLFKDISMTTGLNSYKSGNADARTLRATACVARGVFVG